MRERSWKVALAAVALAATVMALYVQFFERRSTREADRAAAARLEESLERSHARLRAEILAQLRAELGTEGATPPAGGQPLPNAVLRRGEAGALQQVLDPQESQESVQARLQAKLEFLARQMERSDRALRRDLQGLRAEVQREQDASSKVASLLLVALIPLVVHVLISLWPPAGGKRDEKE